MYNKLKLWFFRDLTDYQRRQLFSVFGMPVDEIGYSHGKQEVALRHAVRSLITAKPDTTPPAPQITGEPDYCFDPDNWEFTCHWSDRDEVHGYGDALSHSEPMRVATLIKGPDKWVADVPVTWDEHGDPDETVVKWFDSKEEARAARAATEGSEQ